MANDENRDSILEETPDPDLTPDATPNPVEELNPANDLRGQDYGESGQFAPGGYYNQRAVTKPDRIDLDAQVDAALRNEEGKE